MTQAAVAEKTTIKASYTWQLGLSPGAGIRAIRVTVTLTAGHVQHVASYDALCPGPMQPEPWVRRNASWDALKIAWGEAWFMGDITRAMPRATIATRGDLHAALGLGRKLPPLPEGERFPDSIRLRKEA